MLALYKEVEPYFYGDETTPGLMGDPTGATGGWYEYLNKFKLHDWEVWSRGKLEDLAEKLKRDPDFDMVIVDLSTTARAICWRFSTCSPRASRVRSLSAANWTSGSASSCSATRTFSS